MSDDDELAKLETFTTATMTVQYAVGDQMREVQVLTAGFTLDDHLERLQTDSEENPHFVKFLLATGGGIGLRINSIVAIELPR